MAFLPGYDVIGMHAITLLAVFRCLQGLALGGSWDGLPSLLALNAPPQRRGWYAMLGQLGAPIGFMVASALFLFLHLTLTQADFLEWGWRYPFFVAFAINVVALFARLRLVVTEEYTQLLEEGELEPIAIVEIVRDQGYNLFLGAFAALASYALFHLVTVFPLSWIAVSGTQQISDVLIVQIVGAAVGILGTMVSGWIADRIGRRTTLGLFAAAIGVFALVSPWLLDGGPKSQDAFILIGFALLGLSYGRGLGHGHGELLAPLPLHRRGADVRHGLAVRRGLRAAGRAGPVGASGWWRSACICCPAWPAPCWRCASTRRWKTRATEWLSHSAARGALRGSYPRSLPGRWRRWCRLLPPHNRPPS